MSDLARCIRDVQERKELVTIVYKSHERWPLPREPHSSLHTIHTDDTRQDFRISVLDSSFNPPTLAHLALARSRPPSSSDESDDYDARLLLLSVRNADKAAPKPGEATHEQRVEMMIRLAQDLEETPSSNTNGPPRSRSVAVAIIDEPTFARKSSVLRRFLQDLIAKLDMHSTGELDESNASEIELPKVHSRRIKLSFVMGFDTLERFLAQRYYNSSLTEMHDALHRFFAPPPDGDDSEVVCAWRGQKLTQNKPQIELPICETQRKMQETLSIAQPFITAGNISFILLTDSEMSLSSTEVRAKRLRGLSDWRAMVPTRVGEYMEGLDLYTCG